MGHRPSTRGTLWVWGKECEEEANLTSGHGERHSWALKTSVDGSTILRKFIYVIMTQILYHISHQEVKSTSPPLESGLALGLVLTNRK